MDRMAFEIAMVDRLSAPTKAMDKELAALDAQLRQDQKELAAMESAMRSLQQATVVDIEAFKKLRSEITAKKDGIAALTTQQVKLGGVGRTVTKETKAMGKGFAESAEEAASAESALAGMGSKVGALLNPVTLATAAVLGLGAALVALVGGGAALSIAAAQAKGDVVDALSLVMETQGEVESTYAELGAITDKLGTSVESTQKLAESLALAGLESRDTLLDAVDAIQTAGKFSESASSKLQSVIEKAGASGKFDLKAKDLKGTGVALADFYSQLSAQTGKGVKQLEAEMKAGKVSLEAGVQALSKAVDVKLGAKAREKGRGFDESVQRFKNSARTLFEDVNIGPFEEALARVADYLDTSSGIGKELKETLTAAFDGTFRLLAKAVPYAEALFLGLLLVVLKIFNATYNLRRAFKDAFGGDSIVTVERVESALIFVADAVGWVVQQMADLYANKPMLYALAAGAAVLAAPFILTQVAVLALIAAFVGLVAVGAKVTAWFGGLVADAWNAGAALVDGLVLGIQQAGPKLIQSVKGLADDAIKSFKKTFGIASPSRVMMGVGVNLGQGLEKGLEREAPERHLRLVADRSMEALEMEAPSPRSRPEALAPSLAGGPAAKAAPASAPTITVSFPNMQVTITGVEGADQLTADLLMPVFADAMEKALLASGSKPAGSADVASEEAA